MLLADLPHFPEGSKVPMMVRLPQYPSLINFSLEKLQAYSAELFPAKIIRIHGRMVRKSDSSSTVDEVFRTRIGLEFTEINPQDQKVISDYVNVFAANVFHLQTVLETVNSNPEALEKARLISGILGYDSSLKVSQLRAVIALDYKSLSIL